MTSLVRFTSKVGSTEDSSSFFKIIFKPKAQSDECLPEDSCF